MRGAVPAEGFVGLDTESDPSRVVTGELGWCKASIPSVDLGVERADCAAPTPCTRSHLILAVNK